MDVVHWWGLQKRRVSKTELSAACTVRVRKGNETLAQDADKKKNVMSQKPQQRKDVKERTINPCRTLQRCPIMGRGMRKVLEGGDQQASGEISCILTSTTRGPPETDSPLCSNTLEEFCTVQRLQPQSPNTDSGHTWRRCGHQLEPCQRACAGVTRARRSRAGGSHRTPSSPKTRILHLPFSPP